jgi:hypothetical protein
MNFKFLIFFLCFKRHTSIFCWINYSVVTWNVHFKNISTQRLWAHMGLITVNDCVRIFYYYVAGFPTAMGCFQHIDRWVHSLHVALMKARQWWKQLIHSDLRYIWREEDFKTKLKGLYRCWTLSLKCDALFFVPAILTIFNLQTIVCSKFRYFSAWTDVGRNN